MHQLSYSFTRPIDLPCTHAAPNNHVSEEHGRALLAVYVEATAKYVPERYAR